MKKRITLIVFSVLIIAALYVLYCFNYIPHKKYTNADFNIEAYKSNIDKDNDGIDDQTDILNNANNYIKTNPKYKSKYYYYGNNEKTRENKESMKTIKEKNYETKEEESVENDEIKSNKTIIDQIDKYLEENKE